MTAPTERKSAFVRWLLGMLGEDETLLTRPISEVREDLAALDVDPNELIAVARRLSSKETTVTEHLYRTVIDDEAWEADLDDVVAKDIDAVRGGVPTGSSAAIVADAVRRAGGESNVSGIGRFRRPWRAVTSGTLKAAGAVGFAAYILIVAWVVAGDLGFWGDSSEQARAPGQQAPVLTASARPDEMVALLIIDPVLAPDSLTALNLPQGTLLRRLSEARAAAGGRPVVALAEVLGPDGLRDLAFVAPGNPSLVALGHDDPSLAVVPGNDDASPARRVTIPDEMETARLSPANRELFDRFLGDESDLDLIELPGDGL